MNCFKKIIRYSWVLLITLLLLWIIPETVQKALEEKEAYPFTYYSSVRKEFCTTNTISKNNVLRKDESGNSYTAEGFDTIMPLFFYRQMLSKGKMPDSINGYPISLRSIRTDGFYLRFSPNETDSPEIPLYPLFEAYTGRVKLEMPEDVFRIKNGIEFINVSNNKVNNEKSNYFSHALDKVGLQYPVKGCYGNPTARKSYDEGYFIQDAENHLFHMKMVNSKPFIREVKEVRDIPFVYFKMYEIGNRNFYGFIFDKEHNVYLLTTDNYKLKKLPFKIDPYTEKLLIMANPVYWTVQITNKDGRQYYAVDAHSLKIIREITQSQTIDLWEKINPYLFPIRITFEKYNSGYVYPRIYKGNLFSIVIGIALALILFITNRRKSNWCSFIWIILTGFAGFISLFLLKKH
ncbi:DUF4857 domain-containing protein [Halosquirtibacter xylanolyticus]|uniref:DUF4857 domain-containing protein n=1 Tax=Halosquirtibacter xylanolyticus TaxID=3374599 RepID=UPI0037496C98|nr:DUF4857 domain-containing protein [Prolixibacteraceae bacterium]